MQEIAKIAEQVRAAPDGAPPGRCQRGAPAPVTA